MLRRPMLVLGAVALTGMAVAGRAAYARAPIALHVVDGAGECAVSWQKSGVSLTPQTPGKAPSSFALAGPTGTLNITGDLLTLAANPARLGNAIDISLSPRGGFILKDAKGNFVDVSGGEGTLPQGGATFLVKTPANPHGTRIPVFAYAAPAQLDPRLSLTPRPNAAVRVRNVDVTVPPEFARVLNETFGPGSARIGAPFASCAGDLTAR